MCLDKVKDTEPLDDDEWATRGVGYMVAAKVLEGPDEGRYFSFYRGARLMRRWTRDHAEGRILSLRTDTYYPKGFHIFTDLEGLIFKYSIGDIFSTMHKGQPTDVRAVILKVEWKDPVAVGTQHGKDVVVVRSRRILEEVIG